MYKTHEQPSFLDASNVEVRRATWCQFLAPVIGTSSWHQFLVPGFLAPVIGTNSWHQLLVPGSGARCWCHLVPVTGAGQLLVPVLGARCWCQVIIGSILFARPALDYRWRDSFCTTWPPPQNKATMSCIRPPFPLILTLLQSARSMGRERGNSFCTTEARPRKKKHMCENETLQC